MCGDEEQGGRMVEFTGLSFFFLVCVTWPAQEWLWKAAWNFLVLGELCREEGGGGGGGGGERACSSGLFFFSFFFKNQTPNVL